MRHLALLPVLFFFLGSALLASDEAAFLETIQLNRGDDTARLVYADWLDEHGRPARADYIRKAIKYEREAPHGYGNIAAELKRLADEAEHAALIEMIGEKAMDDLERSGIKLFWERGLLRRVHVPSRSLHDKRVIEALNAIPFAFEFSFERKGSTGTTRQARMSPREFIRQLEKVNLKDRVYTLALDAMTHDGFSHEDLRDVLALTPKIRGLRLSGHVTHAYLDVIAKSHLAPTLRELDWVGLHVNPSDAVAITHGNFPQLESIKMRTNNLDLRPFHDLKTLPNLRELVLDHSGHAGIVNTVPDFVRSTGFLQLRAFGVTGNRQDLGYSQDDLEPVIAQVKHQLTDVRFRFNQEAKLPELVAQIQHNREALPPRCFHLVESLL